MLIDQGRVGEVARQGVEDTAADRCFLHAEVMAMEQVVGGHVVESGDSGYLPACRESDRPSWVNTRPTTKSTTMRRTSRRNSETFINLFRVIRLLDHRDAC